MVKVAPRTETTARLHPTPPTSRCHSRRGRFNAWFFDSFHRYINTISRPHKYAAFAGLGAGRILEIGAGTGANFAYFPVGSTIVALEPNAAMHRRLERRARDLDIDLEVVTAPAEEIPLPADSVDTVVSTLVLCTVENPDLVLSEIKRVLRPGGALRFVEHVAAHPASPRRWVQNALARPWSWVWEGCQLCRETDTTLERAGFSSVDTHRRRFRYSVFVPINTAIYGRATK